MILRPIHTEQEYKEALKAVSPFFDNEPEPESPESIYFEQLITAIETYERRHEATA